jgi:hypothetical protein
MKRLFFSFLSILFLIISPAIVFSESLEQEARRVCSDYVRIKKDCYYKSAKGMLPDQMLKSIKNANYPEGLVQMACQDGYDSYGRVGKQPTSAVNQGMQLSYTNCYNGYVERGYEKATIIDLKNAYTSAQAYFSDEPKGTISIEKLYSYGFKASNDVVISIQDGSANGLKISSKHAKSEIVRAIDAEGNILKQ